MHRSDVHFPGLAVWNQHFACDRLLGMRTGPQYWLALHPVVNSASATAEKGLFPLAQAQLVFVLAMRISWMQLSSISTSEVLPGKTKSCCKWACCISCISSCKSDISPLALQSFASCISRSTSFCTDSCRISSRKFATSWCIAKTSRCSSGASLVSRSPRSRERNVDRLRRRSSSDVKLRGGSWPSDDVSSKLDLASCSSVFSLRSVCTQLATASKMCPYRGAVKLAFCSSLSPKFLQTSS